MITKILPIPFGGRENATLALYCVEKSREKPDEKPHPTILVIPGGGYHFVSLREGEPIALRFAAYGYNAAVLTYSVDGTPFPQQLGEAAQAIALLREHAEEWFIDPRRIAVCGFSAGGHLALTLGVHWNKPWLTEKVGKDAEALRPDALILAYPVVTNDPRHFHKGSFLHLLGEDPDPALLELTSLEKQIHPAVPPVFLWHTETDQTVPVMGSVLLMQALTENAVPWEAHVFGWGPHGTSLADVTTAKVPGSPHDDAHLAHWDTLAREWLARTLPEA